MLEIVCRYGKFFLVEPLLSMGEEPTRKCLYYTSSKAKSSDSCDAVRLLILAGADATELLSTADSWDRRFRVSLWEIVLSAGVTKRGRSSFLGSVAVIVVFPRPAS